ncbi:hypothetical protein [Paenibacillus ferrarius]|uniref:hypothetical protein n=1 Tax=Paenibacillus ferrarius TaxID=1469647 RepID=UPI003D26754B
MKKLFISITAIGVVFFVLSLFSPWVTERFASAKALRAFKGQWKNTADGCGFACKDCGFVTSQKAAFGRKVEIEFACGLLPADDPKYHRRKELFVSFLGTVH